MQRHLTIRAWLVLGMGVAFATSAHAQDESVLLRLAPPAGQVTPYLIAMDVTMSVPDNPMMDAPMTMRQEIYTTYTVSDTEGDAYTLSTIIDSVSVDVTGVPGMAGQTGEMERMMEGVSSRIRMTTRGEVVQVEMDEETLNPAMQQGMSGMGDFMGGISLELPEEPVRPGTTWTVPVDKTLDLGGVGQMHQQMELTYRLERLETRGGARYAMLSFTGTLTQELVGDAAEMGMSIHYEGDMTGTMDLNLEAGRFDSLTLEMALDGTSEAMGQTMSMAMNMHMEQGVLGR